MGLVLLATVLGLLPSQFLIFWLLVLIIVGLGGLLISDRDEWLTDKTSNQAKKALVSKSKSKSKAKKRK